MEFKRHTMQRVRLCGLINMNKQKQYILLIMKQLKFELNVVTQATSSHLFRPQQLLNLFQSN